MKKFTLTQSILKAYAALCVIAFLLTASISCEKQGGNPDENEESKNDVIAYWPLDGNGKDSSGNGNTATLFNLRTTADRFCDPDGALHFNGVNGYASVADKMSLRLHDTDFTLNAWIKLEAYGESYGSTIMSKRIYGANNGWQTSIAGYMSSPLGVLTYGPGGGSTNAWGTAKVELNEWHMVTSVYKISNKTLSIYVDGVLDKTIAGILSPNGEIASELRIGHDESTNIYFLEGALDDITIYSRELKPQEVKELYATTKGECAVTPEGKENPLDGLIAYWPFNGNGKDSTGNGNTAAINNLTPVADRHCNPSGAFYFNGFSSYASVADTRPLRLNNTDFTLNAWIKLDSYGESYGSTIMSKRIYGANNGWQTSIAGYMSSPLGVLTYGPGGGSINAWGTVKVELNEWHMVTSVYKLSDKTLSIYIDGVLDKTVAGILSPNGDITSALRIGHDESTSIYYLKAALDDVRIYGRSLSSEQVKALYTSTKGGCEQVEY